MKRALWLLAALLFAADIAHADVYVKAKAVNGMGVNETWYSGKKRREVVHVDLGGGMQNTQINITRVDLDREWELDTDLHMYRERTISIPDTPEESVPAEMRAKPDDKWVDLPKEEKDICEPQLVTLPNKQTIAGYEATGYQAVCPKREELGAPRMTLWMSPAKGDLAQFDKDMKAFEKEYRKVQFKKMTAAERKFTEEFFGAFGEGAGSMLLGLRVDKIPKGVPLKMEQDATIMANGQPGQATLYEMLEVHAQKADPSMFEIPAGYTKITNDEEYGKKQMQVMADKMGMGNEFRNQMAANEAYAKMLPPESGEPSPQPAAPMSEPEGGVIQSEPEALTAASSAPGAQAAHVPIPPPPQVQEDTTNEDFDARDYAS